MTFLKRVFPKRPKKRPVDLVLDILPAWLREGDEATFSVHGLSSGIGGDPAPLSAVKVVGLVIKEVEDA